MRRLPLTLRGIGALAVAAACVAASQLWGSVQLLAVGLLLGALVLAAVVALRARSRPSGITRTVRSPLVHVGESVEVAVTVTAPGPRALASVGGENACRTVRRPRAPPPARS